MDKRIFSENDANFIKALSYLIGIFNKYDLENKFMKAVWAHLFLLILICLDSYIQKLENLINEEIENTKFLMTKLIAKNLRTNKLEKIMKTFNIDERPIAISRPSAPSYTLSRKNSRVSENFMNNFKNNSEVYRNIVEECTASLYDNNIIGEDVKRCYVLKKFMRVFIKIDVRNRISKSENSNEFSEIKNIASIIPRNLYISFFSFVSKFFEEFIIFLLILSALFKLDVLSIFYIILVAVFQIIGKNYKKIYLISLIISYLIIIQTIIFLSNLSSSSDPNSGDDTVKNILIIIKRYLGIPWLDQSKESIPMEFFLSLGVNNYQVLILWIEFLIIIVSFIYFDNFCFTIYLENENPYGFINFYYYSKHHILKNSINLYTEDKYNNLKQDLGKNFFIELPEFNFFLSKINKDYDKQMIQSFDMHEEEKNINKESLNFKKLNNPSLEKLEKLKEKGPKNKSGVSYLNILARKNNSKFFESTSIKKNSELSKLSSNNNKKGKCYKLCVKMRKFMYLNMHNFTLILTLFLSLLNTGAISAIYIGFVIYNLNTSYSIKRKKNFTFPRFIKYKFRFILILDILLQLIYQIPLDVFKQNEVVNILNKIGIYKIKNDKYEINATQLYEDKLALVLIKALTYLLLSIQVIIYSSNDFKDFYLKYILKNSNISFKKAILNSFLYNNRLIEKMKKVIKSRESIDELLEKLENQINEWSNINIIKKNSQLRVNKPLALQKRHSADKNGIENSNSRADEYKAGNNLERDKAIDNDTNQNDNNQGHNDNRITSTSIDKQTEKFNFIRMNSTNINNSVNFHDVRRFEDEDHTNLKDRLEAKYDDFFQSQNRTKLYFKKCLHELFLIELINIFNRNTANFIFMKKEDTYKFERSIFRGDTYYKSSLEEKIDEEIDKMNFSDISQQEIDIIFKNIDKARKIICKKIASRDKNKKKKLANKNKLKKRKSNNIISCENKLNKDVIQEITDSEGDSDNYEEEEHEIFKDDQNIEGVSLNKYNRILNNKIFEKYYSQKNIWSYIFYHLFEYLLDNFQFICFFMMLLNNLLNANIISLFWPLLVFTFGIISNPRPGNIFWKISMIFCSAVIMVKFILQMQINEYYSKGLREYFLLDQFRIGLKIFPDIKTAEFINYIIWDCLLLLCLLIQQYILITNGLWKKVEYEIETIKEAHERDFKIQKIKTEKGFDELADQLFNYHINKLKTDEAKKSAKPDKTKSQEKTNKTTKSAASNGKEEKSSKEKKDNNKIRKKTINHSKTLKPDIFPDTEMKPQKEKNINSLNSAFVPLIKSDNILTKRKLGMKKSNSIFLDHLTFGDKNTPIQELENNLGSLKKNSYLNEKTPNLASSNLEKNRKSSFIEKSNILNERLKQTNKTKENQEKNFNKRPQSNSLNSFFTNVFPNIRVRLKFFFINFKIIYIIILKKYFRIKNPEKTSMLSIVHFL